MSDIYKNYMKNVKNIHYVYMVLEYETDNLKIGYASHIIGRIFGYYNKDKIYESIVDNYKIDFSKGFYIKVNGKCEAEKLESKLHYKYENKNIKNGNGSGKNEWFKDGVAILIDIEKDYKEQIIPIENIFNQNI